MKKVITYGTFDYFHYGHYNLLKRAKALGDYLIVGVSSDEMCRQKGKITILDEKTRMDIVKDLKFVDEVIIENSMEQKCFDVKASHVDIFVLGSDYSEVFPKMPEYKELLKMNCEVVFLERTKDISTTQLKNKLLAQLNTTKKY